MLEARWKEPTRTVNALAAAGVLAGFMAFGVAIVAMIIFPLAILASINIVTRWGWLDSRLTYAQAGPQRTRRPLYLFYVAAAAPLLITWPMFIFWMAVSSSVSFPIGLAYGYIRPGLDPIARQHAEEGFMFQVAFFLGVLLYCGLLNRAFRRLIGMRSRALAWQVVGWIFLLWVCFGLLNSWLGTSNRAETVSDMFLPWLLTSIVTVYLLKQAGSVYGTWLLRASVMGRK
jgi:hypothetical protein